MKPLIPFLLILPLAACSWGIKLDSGGKDIRVAWNDDVSGCRVVGAINVSVLDRLGPVDRSRLKVSDELEVMARNQAATLAGADTIKPVAEPRDGAQDWTAYACGSRRPLAPAPVAVKPDDGQAVETYPIKDD